MSDSMRPHRQQPTRLHHPWDSLGKNTGVGCHFLLQCMKVKSESEVAQWYPTLLATPWTVAYQAPPSMGFSRQEYWSGVPLPSPIIHLNTSKCLSISTLSLSLVFPWKMSCQDDMVWPTFNKLTYFSTAVEYIIFLVGRQWGEGCFLYETTYLSL